MKKTKDLNDMMLFIAVIDAGSFTLAADRLNIPKANLSRKISRLEKQLGVTLLERTTRSQHITEAGNHYLGHCRRISQEIELADASISQILEEPKGELRIGVSVGMGHEIIKPVLAKFMHQHPAINLELNLLNSRVDLIEEGYDLVIRIGELEDSRLVAKRLGTICRKIYSSPAYLEGYGEIEEIEQLGQADFLMMGSIHNSESVLLASKEKQYELNVTPRMLVNDFLVLKQMVVEGLGVAIIPDYMCEQELGSRGLIALLPGWGMLDVDVYALYPKYRMNVPKVKVFLDFLKIVFAERLVT
jgi:LysR family transcriptional regulator AphB